LLNCFIVIQAASLNFIQFDDKGYWNWEKYDIAVVAGKAQLRFFRETIKKPVYDGSSGKTRVKVIEQNANGSSVKLDLTLDYVYHFLGFNEGDNTLYLLKEGQTGAEITIISLISINIDDQKIIELFNSKAFQYASISPNGTRCLFVDSDVYMYNFFPKKIHKISIKEELLNNEANPPRKHNGGIIGGGANLTGEHMEMKWKDCCAGELIVRDLNKKIIKKIKIKG